MRNHRLGRQLRLLLITSLGVVLAVVAVGQGGAEDPGSASRGSSCYEIYCKTCHGVMARGDGVLAPHLRETPADLTRIRVRHDGDFPADRVGKAIREGRDADGHSSEDMPAWEDALRRSHDGGSEEQVRQRIADLVRYLETIQV